MTAEEQAFQIDREQYERMRKWVRGAFVFASTLLLSTVVGAPIMAAFDAVPEPTYTLLSEAMQEIAFCWVSSLGVLGGAEIMSKRR